MDLSRREFAQVGVVSLASLQTGGVDLQLDPREEYDFQGAADLLGLAAARPQPGDPFFANAEYYAFRYTAADTGAVSVITQDDSAWRQVPATLKPYQNEYLPASAPTGHLVFDEDHGTPAWWDRDHWEFPNFVDDVLESPQTVANTTTRTQVFDPGINRDSLIRGRIYQLDIHGVYQTTNTSSQFTVDVNIAGVDAAGVQNAAANVPAGTPWTLELTFTVRDHGQNGTIKSNTRATFNEQPRTASHSPITVDTTTATELTVYLTWNNADAENSVTVEQAHIKQMG